MATQTQYYNIDKPSYDEVADIEIINANFDKIDQQMRNNADGVNFAKGISSDAYDNSKLYAVGDYCIYDNKLYRCITAIDSAEAFNVAKWEQTTVGKEVKQLNSNLDNLAYGKNGVHNLLNPTLQSTTKNGITCTNNGDGTYTFNGTVDSGAYPEFNLGMITLDKGEYLFTNQDSTIYLWCGTSKGNDDIINRPLIGGTFINIKNKSDIYISLVCSSGETYHNVVIKPMITEDLTATYDDFVPYIPSVKMLAEEVSAQNESLSVIGKCKNLLKPVFVSGLGCNCVIGDDGKITLTSTNTEDYQFVIGYIHKCSLKANKTYYFRAFDIINIDHIVIGKIGSDNLLESFYNQLIYTPTEDMDIQLLIYFSDKTVGTISSCYISVSEVYTDEYVPYTGDGDTLTHDVAEIKNDLSVKKFELVAGVLWLCVCGKHCVLTLNGYNLTEPTHFDKLEEYQPYLVARNVVSNGNSVCIAAVEPNGILMLVI